MLGNHNLTLRLPQSLKESYEACGKQFAAAFRETIELPDDAPSLIAETVSLLSEAARAIALKNLANAARSVLRRDVAFRFCDLFPMCYH